MNKKSAHSFSVLRDSLWMMSRCASEFSTNIVVFTVSSLVLTSIRKQISCIIKFKNSRWKTFYFTATRNFLMKLQADKSLSRYHWNMRACFAPDQPKIQVWHINNRSCLVSSSAATARHMTRLSYHPSRAEKLLLEPEAWEGLESEFATEETHVPGCSYGIIY